MLGWPVGDFWGKFEKPRAEREPPRWHPLVDHCADVAAVVEALVALPVWRGRLARAGSLQDLDQVQGQRLAVLASLHDVGKFNRSFQAKVYPGAGIRGGHIREALALFDSRLRASAEEALELSTLRTWFDGDGVAEQFLLASLSHHGQPVDPGSEPADPRAWYAGGAPGGRLDPIEGVRSLSAMLRLWFPKAYGPGPPLPATPALQHLYCGLVMLADWVASDTRFFPFSETRDGDRMCRARPNAAEALLAFGIDTGLATGAIRPAPPTFDEMFGVAPRPVQREIERLPLDRAGGAVLLEAETGSGKTEAALRHFLRLFSAGLVDGLYFALPTRSAASQMHRRVARAVAAAFGRAAPPVVLAVPGYIRVDDQSGLRLPGFQVLWPDEEQDRLRFRGWAAEHPKRYLAAPIAVGTVDQVLLSALTVRHSHLRASALARHLLVVDEVHASDPYMTAVLLHVLDHHRRVGGHALLMSATLGSEAATRLLAGPRGAPPPLGHAVEHPYPSLTLGTGHGTGRSAVTRTGPSKRVRVEWLEGGAPSVALVARARAAAKAGARVLIVRNLVADAMATAQMIETELGPDHPLLFRCRAVATVHHSRFAPEDRSALDAAVESRLAREAPPDPVIVVATQTVEQSLDIDADLLMTDLCPMDVLLQRLGRLHRHETRARPQGAGSPVAVILTPPGERARDLGRHIITRGPLAGQARGPAGLGTVYPDLRVLEATWRLLERHPVIDLPAMSRFLVESATHPEALDAITAELGGAWTGHSSRIAGVRVAHALLANGNVVRWDADFGSVDVLFPSGGLADIRTRLGEDDRLVRFEPPLRGPFGQPLSALTVPGRMVPPATPGDDRAEVVTSAGGVTLFRFGNRVFTYDRWGLRLSREPDEEM